MTLPQTPSFRLDGKRALIAGGSAGIGRASAVALAEAGAEVVLVARNKDALDQTTAEMQEQSLKATALQLDITDTSAMQQAVAQADPFDILVNSAGTARHSPAIETTPEDFDAVFNLNTRAAYFLTQAVAKQMLIAGKQGSLINISSQMAQVGGPERAVYCASKHAMEGFTKAMAIEFAPAKIRVNTICPTFILTELARPTLDDPTKKAWLLDKIKLGRVGETEDLMGAVVYLASDASSLVTGTALMIDGGWTAG